MKDSIKLHHYNNFCSTCCHKRGPCHIRLEVELIANHLQDRDEEVIADGAQGHDQVHGHQDVDRDPAVQALLRTQEVTGELFDGGLGAVSPRAMISLALNRGRERESDVMNKEIKTDLSIFLIPRLRPFWLLPLSLSSEEKSERPILAYLHIFHY